MNKRGKNAIYNRGALDCVDRASAAVGRRKRYGGGGGR